MLYRKSIELVATGVVNVTYVPSPFNVTALAARRLVGQLPLRVAGTDPPPVGGRVLGLHLGVRQARPAAARHRRRGDRLDRHRRWPGRYRGNPRDPRGGD